MDNPASLISDKRANLLAVSLKLRSLAYLIESQRGDIDPPLDLPDIYWGLGRLLTELSQAVSIANEQMQAENMRLKKN